MNLREWPGTEERRLRALALYCRVFCVAVSCMGSIFVLNKACAV